MNVATVHRSPSTSLRMLATSPRRGLVEVATLSLVYGLYELVRGNGHATLAGARAHKDAIVMAAGYVVAQRLSACAATAQQPRERTESAVAPC